MNRHFPHTSSVSSEIEENPGEVAYQLAGELFPICRSITGQGVRDTLDIMSRYIDIERHEVPTGTPLFDWTVPREWCITDAWVKDSTGRKIVDFQNSNLHVLNYSAPVHETVSLEKFKQHVFTLPEQPDLIPYRTSYHQERWGFCMAHKQLSELPKGEYEVFIDSGFSDGSLSYGEYFHRGHSPREVLFTAHICHPSLANDNCSGLALLTTLASKLKGRQTRFSYRFLFAPGTIGALAWLAANETRLHRIAGGLVVSCVGDSGGPTYKKSRQGNAIVDRAMEKVILRGREDATIKEFVPYGYDERQFCSPGFDLPMGLFQRSAFGTFPEYHTSADNMDFISADNLNDSFNILMQIIDINENNWTPFSLCPKGEPQLGRRGLYGSVGGDSNIVKDTMPLLWVLNLADGEHSLLDIAERSGYSFSEISAAARILQSSELLTEISKPFASD